MTPKEKLYALEEALMDVTNDSRFDNTFRANVRDDLTDIRDAIRMMEADSPQFPWPLATSAKGK